MFGNASCVSPSCLYNVNIGEFVGYVYEDVCSRCPSRDLCFYRDGNVSRLGKLINKGFKSSYSEYDLKYI